MPEGPGNAYDGPADPAQAGSAGLGHASGAVVAVGIDVASVTRFTAALARTPALAERLFTEAERVTPGGRVRSGGSLAARFAAKEAVAKALGAPLGLDWHDCVVAQEPSGRPHLVVAGTVAAAAAARGVSRFELSLTHDAGIAAAMVIALA